MNLEVSERLAFLCDVRLEGGEEGFEEELAERSRPELEELPGEAVDALLDAEQQHEREMRSLADRLRARGD